MSDDLDEIFQLEIKPVDESIDHCKGLLFRGYTSQYYQNGKFELKQGIKLLKRKSCPGCNECVFLLDNLQELSNTEGAVILPKYGIENGKLYSIHTINETRDWEGGYIDSWDLEIFEIKEKDDE